MLNVVGNASDYVDRLVRARWREWTSALDVLSGAGWRSRDILAACHALNGRQLYGRDARSLAAELQAADQARAALELTSARWEYVTMQLANTPGAGSALVTLVSEYWCGNAQCHAAIGRVHGLHPNAVRPTAPIGRSADAQIASELAARPQRWEAHGGRWGIDVLGDTYNDAIEKWAARVDAHVRAHGPYPIDVGRFHLGGDRFTIVAETAGEHLEWSGGPELLQREAVLRKFVGEHERVTLDDVALMFAGGQRLPGPFDASPRAKS